MAQAEEKLDLQPGPLTMLDTVSNPQQQKWDLLDAVPAKSVVWDYGYFINGQAYGASREKLIDLVQRGIELSFVWTPETPEPVSPEEVPFLLDAFRSRSRKQARNAVLVGAGLVTICIVLAVVLHKWSLVYRNFWSVIGAMSLIEGIWLYSQSRQYNVEDAASDASTARFTAWIKKKNLSGYAFTLAACIVVVSATQFFPDDPIKAAGLVKPAVRNGEIWRLFTSTLMHANFTHFWLNFLALLHFSRIIEQTVHRAYVPLVFVLTAPVGSLFSVVLYPNSTSVGASGGLMGLLGFITIAAYFDKTRYPPRYFRQMIEAIVLVGVFGLVGFSFVDNAGHLGGLVSGLFLGWFFLKKNEHWIKEKKNLLELGGVASLLALGVISAIAVYRMMI